MKRASLPPARRIFSNIDITGKKIQGIYTQAARDLAKRAEATQAGTLTERWVKDYQKAL
ncbi:MAG: hypothetical protein ACLUHE_08335 [Christensenellales bacterium]